MEERIAIIGVIVEDKEKSSEVNDILHNYADYIMGRMGLPDVKGFGVISIVVSAPHDTISAMTGKLGMVEGVNAKAVYSKYVEQI